MAYLKSYNYADSTDGPIIKRMWVQSSDTVFWSSPKPKRSPPPAWWIAFCRAYRRRGFLGHPPRWWKAVKFALSH